MVDGKIQTRPRGGQVLWKIQKWKSKIQNKAIQFPGKFDVTFFEDGLIFLEF